MIDKALHFNKSYQMNDVLLMVKIVSVVLQEKEKLALLFSRNKDSLKLVSVFLLFCYEC